jgi:FkbM family methyltransferase
VSWKANAVVTAAAIVMKVRHSMTFVAHARRTGRRAARLARETFDLPNRGRAILRWAVFATVRHFTPTVRAEVDGVRYFVSTADQSVGRLLFMGVVPDGDLFTAAVALVEQETGLPALADRTLVEVGANIGTTTLPAVLQHDARRVLALEPEPECLKLLRANLVTNDIDEQRILVLPIAASDHAGVAEFEICTSNSGDGRIRTGDRTGGPDLYGELRRPVVKVPTARLDDLLGAQNIAFTDIGLVWIDTQGHEAQVLDGAPGLLASDAPIVLEYWPYGLRRAGGLERLATLIAGSGRRIIDLRASAAAGRVMEVTDLARLPHHYGKETYTDLALLPPTPAAGTEGSLR